MPWPSESEFTAAEQASEGKLGIDTGRRARMRGATAGVATAAFAAPGMDAGRNGSMDAERSEGP